MDNGGPFKDVLALPLIYLLATGQRVHDISRVPVQGAPLALYAPLGSHIIQGRFPGLSAEADILSRIADFPTVRQGKDDAAVLGDFGRGAWDQTLHQSDADEPAFRPAGKLGVFQNVRLPGQICRTVFHPPKQGIR